MVTPVAGHAIDRFGNRPALAAAVAASSGGVLLTLSRHLWLVAAGLAACSTGVFAAQASASTLVGLGAERNRALALGLYSTFYYLGGSAGSSVTGFFYTWGGWPACAIFIASVQIVTILIALLFWKPATAPHVSDDVPSISA